MVWDQIINISDKRVCQNYYKILASQRDFRELSDLLKWPFLCLVTVNVLELFPMVP